VLAEAMAFLKSSRLQLDTFPRTVAVAGSEAVRFASRNGGL